MLLFILILLPFAASVIAPTLVRSRLASLLALLPLGLFVCFAGTFTEVTSGNAIVQEMRWIPSLGISLALRLDALALLFALLITGIGTCIYLYASHYLEDESAQPRFFAYLSLFMGAMLGAVLADDFITLLVFWELTSLTSFLLIGHDPEQATSRRAAQQGLLITVGGGLALLAGIILLGNVAGTLRLTEIIASAPQWIGHAQVPAIIALIAIGAFAKSAQAPLHSWLANAMAAPTPVSAFLHSATMVKLGVYLLARLNPALGSHPLWSELLVPVGLLTMVVGTVLALRSHDIKRLLAYSTVVSLGTLIAFIGMPFPFAATAMVTFLLTHALYKACLFMVAGIIDHATGTRDATRLGGLMRAMPLTAVICMLAAASMAGLPPFLGFIGKELMYETGLDGNWFPIAVMLLANACMVVIAGILAVRCFFGAPRQYDHTPHDPSWAMWIGPLGLALAGLAFGLLPQLPQQLITPAANAVTTATAPPLALWHGITPMLALSVCTLAFGALVLWQWPRLYAALQSWNFIELWGPDRGYDHAMTALQRVAVWQTSLIQSGSLRHYVGNTFIVIAIGLFATLYSRDVLQVALPSLTDIGMEIALPILLVLCAAATLCARNFMAGIVAAGTVGFVVALTFLFNGAPDLAFTQFSVEALSIVILLAIIGRLPFNEADSRSRDQRRRDALIAIAVAVALTLILLTVVAGTFDPRLSDFYRAVSVPEAHGRNLVNVIIVDFRALDTLGEITVLALAAMAATAVIISARARRAADANPRTPHDKEPS